MSDDDRKLAAELVVMMEEQGEFLRRTGTGPVDAQSPRVRLERRAMGTARRA